MSSEFADRLIYWHFRSAIRLGHTMGRLDSALFKKLLQSAIYDELAEQGYTKGATAAALNVAPATVTTWSRETLKPWSWPEGGHMMKRIVTSLEQQKNGMSELDLEELCRNGAMTVGKIHQRPANKGPSTPPGEDDDGFTYRYVLALQRLKALGYVEEVRARSGTVLMRLSKLWHKEAERTFVQPFDEECEILGDVVEISLYLLKHDRALSFSELTSDVTVKALQLTHDRIATALALCQTLAKGGGASPIVIEEKEGERYYRLLPHANISSRDEINRQQAGAIRLVKELCSFLEWLANDPPGEEVAQKTTFFRVRRSDLPGLLKQHYQNFNQQVEQAQERAKGATDVINYAFVWMGYQTRDKSTPPGRK